MFGSGGPLIERFELNCIYLPECVGFLCTDVFIVLPVLPTMFPSLVSNENLNMSKYTTYLEQFPVNNLLYYSCFSPPTEPFLLF